MSADHEDSVISNNIRRSSLTRRQSVKENEVTPEAKKVILKTIVASSRSGDSNTLREILEKHKGIAKDLIDTADGVSSRFQVL
jgi:hypothetical protein